VFQDTRAKPIGIDKEGNLWITSKLGEVSIIGKAINYESEEIKFEKEVILD